VHSVDLNQPRIRSPRVRHPSANGPPQTTGRRVQRVAPVFPLRPNRVSGFARAARTTGADVSHCISDCFFGTGLRGANVARPRWSPRARRRRAQAVSWRRPRIRHGPAPRRAHPSARKPGPAAHGDAPARPRSVSQIAGCLTQVKPGPAEGDDAWRQQPSDWPDEVVWSA
jgi:hypothetical protein